MQFTDYFAKKIQKNPNFDFLNTFSFDKTRFRQIDLSFGYFLPTVLHKFPVLPLSHEKRSDFRQILAREGAEDIT